MKPPLETLGAILVGIGALLSISLARSTPAVGQDRWLTDLDQAVWQAGESKKPILAAFL